MQSNNSNPNNLLTIGLRKTAEQLRAERLERAREKGEYYREISLHYADWCKLPQYPIVRPNSLPAE
jgi:hypothetical protein